MCEKSTAVFVPPHTTVCIQNDFKFTDGEVSDELSKKREKSKSEFIIYNEPIVILNWVS